MCAGREFSVLFHSHLHSGFSCLFQPPPAETFQLPEIRVIKLFPEVRLQMLGACFLHIGVYVTHVRTETHTQTCNSTGAQYEGEEKKKKTTGFVAKKTLVSNYSSAWNSLRDLEQDH